MAAKILHIINGEFYAGAERVQDLLAAGLPDHGYVVGFAALKDGAFKLNRRHQTAPIFDMPMASKFDVGIGVRLAELAAREGYDAFHSHTTRSLMAGALAAWRSGKPLLHHVHSPVSRDTESLLRNIINGRIESVCLPRAVKMIAVSGSLHKELLKKGVSPVRLALVPNGVPVARSEPHWQPPSAGQEWVLGMVALFRPRKGVEVLLQALQQLRAEGLKVRLRLVGGFESLAYEQAIRDLASRWGLEGAIDWVGFTRDVGVELRRMHLFVVPSLFGEGLPMVMIEAMAAALPVVGSRVEGIPEVLQAVDGGVGAGLVVEPDDAAALTTALATVMKSGNLATRLAANGHARQRDFYSDRAMAAGVAAVYRDIRL